MAVVPECLPSSVWAKAWAELYKVFSEQKNQEALDTMDTALSTAVSDAQDEIERESKVKEVSNGS